MKPGKYLFAAFLAVWAAAAHGQGTVTFVNGSLTRFQLQRADGVRSNVPPNTPINFGLFWGTNPAAVQAELDPVLPLGVMSTTPGVMTVPDGSGGRYTVETAQPGQRVFLQVKGWSSSFGSDWRAAKCAFYAGAQALYAETDIRQLDMLGLGPINGPGVLIWQSATGTNPNRFYPLFFYPTEPPLNSPRPNLTILNPSAAQFTVRIVGVPWHSYAIEAKEDLNSAAWTTLQTQCTADNGFFDYVSPAAGSAQRFYRAWLVHSYFP